MQTAASFLKVELEIFEARATNEWTASMRQWPANAWMGLVVEDALFTENVKGPVVNLMSAEGLRVKIPEPVLNFVFEA